MLMTATGERKWIAEVEIREMSKLKRLNSFRLSFLYHEMAKYKWERNPKMTIEEFEEANQQYFIDGYLERFPWHVHFINDGEMAHYYNHLDRDLIKEMMIERYTEWVDSQ